MLKWRNGVYYDWPGQSIGQMIVYPGRSLENVFEKNCPKTLWALLDMKDPKKNIYFLDEESLHYFVSQNVGEDHHHGLAKMLRRGRHELIKRKVFVNVGEVKIKDLQNFQWNSNQSVLLDLTILSNSVVSITPARLKVLDNWEG